MTPRAGLMAAALVALWPGHAPAQGAPGPEAAVAACLAAADGQTDAGTGAPFEDRWAALRAIAAAESGCLTRSVSDCVHLFGAGDCLAGHRATLDRALARAMDALPLPEEVGGRLAKPYADWIDVARRARASSDGGAGLCPMPAGLQADGCPALASADLLIRARDWRRILNLVETLK